MATQSELKDDLLGKSSAREIIHDLRNLFAIVASGRNLLADDKADPERLRVLRAIEDAAVRGVELTSRLLTRETGRRVLDLVDVGAQIAGLAPMLQAFAKPMIELEIDTQVAVPAALVMADAAELDAAILELVANAKTAGACRLVLRCRQVGMRIWILLADDGPGLSMDGMDKGRRRDANGFGIGLGRVRRVVEDLNGKLLIRSSAAAGGGTAIAMILPVVDRTTGNSRARGMSALTQKEMCDVNRDRRSVAA